MDREYRDQRMEEPEPGREGRVSLCSEEKLKFPGLGSLGGLGRHRRPPPGEKVAAEGGVEREDRT